MNLHIHLEGYARPITVWEFEDAPIEYQQMTQHGGDEDYIALVPSDIDAKGVSHPMLDFLDMDGGSWFGRCGTDTYALPNGDKVLIGAHA